MQGKCKFPWCKGDFIDTDHAPQGYCSMLHRRMNEALDFDDELNAELDRYAGEAFELEEKVTSLKADIKRLSQANEEYRRSIFNLYSAEGQGFAKFAEAKYQLYKLAGIPKE